MADDTKVSSIPGPVEVSDLLPAEEGGECELFGIFGIFIQFLLALICTSSLVGKFGKILTFYNYSYLLYFCLLHSEEVLAWGDAHMEGILS